MTRFYTSRRRLIMGAGLLGVAGLSQAMYPRRRVAGMTDSQFEALFPKSFGAWEYVAASGLILPPQDQLSEAIYEQLLTRIYADDQNSAEPQDSVMMLVAYSSVQEGKLHVHRPDVCYPAAGFTISDSRQVSVPVGQGHILPCSFLVAERGARRENIVYWTRVGDAFPLRWSEQRWTMAKANLAGFVPDGLLGRLSVVSADSDAALATMTGFLQTLLSSVSRPARSLLVGSL